MTGQLPTPPDNISLSDSSFRENFPLGQFPIPKIFQKTIPCQDNYPSDNFSHLKIGIVGGGYYWGRIIQGKNCSGGELFQGRLFRGSCPLAGGICPGTITTPAPPAPPQGWSQLAMYTLSLSTNYCLQKGLCIAVATIALLRLIFSDSFQSIPASSSETRNTSQTEKIL